MWIVIDYECPKHGRSEQFMPRPAPDSIPCPKCGKPASKVFPCPGFVKVDPGTIGRGKSEPPPPWAMWTDPDVSESKRKAHNKRRREMYRRREFGIQPKRGTL